MSKEEEKPKQTAMQIAFEKAKQKEAETRNKRIINSIKKKENIGQSLHNAMLKKQTEE